MPEISTTKGMIDEASLEKREGVDASGAAWVEYYLNGELVHRSVTASVTGVASQAEAGGFE